MKSKMLQQHQEAYRQSLRLFKVQLWMLLVLHKLLIIWVQLALLIRA